MSVPHVIRLSYQRHSETGLLAAYSEDLKGLLVTARTFEEIHEELPVVIADLVKQRYGVNIRVEWAVEEPVAPGFEKAIEKCARLELAA
jgi:hypothetical protein